MSETRFLAIFSKSDSRLKIQIYFLFLGYPKHIAPKMINRPLKTNCLTVAMKWTNKRLYTSFILELKDLLRIGASDYTMLLSIFTVLCLRFTVKFRMNFNEMVGVASWIVELPLQSSKLPMRFGERLCFAQSQTIRSQFEERPLRPILLHLSHSVKSLSKIPLPVGLLPIQFIITIVVCSVPRLQT